MKGGTEPRISPLQCLWHLSLIADRECRPVPSLWQQAERRGWVRSFWASAVMMGSVCSAVVYSPLLATRHSQLTVLAAQQWPQLNSAPSSTAPQLNTTRILTLLTAQQHPQLNCAHSSTALAAQQRSQLNDSGWQCDSMPVCGTPTWGVGVGLTWASCDRYAQVAWSCHGAVT